MEIQFQTIYYVYIMTHEDKDKLCVGITLSLKESFEASNKTSLRTQQPFLMYYEVFEKALDAIGRESKLLGYSQRRLKKLVKTVNPGMKFLEIDLAQVDHYSRHAVHASEDGGN